MLLRTQIIFRSDEDIRLGAVEIPQRLAHITVGLGINLHPQMLLLIKFSGQTVIDILRQIRKDDEMAAGFISRCASSCWCFIKIGHASPKSKMTKTLSTTKGTYFFIVFT